MLMIIVIIHIIVILFDIINYNLISHYIKINILFLQNMYLIQKNAFNSFKIHSWNWSAKDLFNIFKFIQGVHFYIHHVK